MGENSILALEHVVRIVPSLHVVLVHVNRVGTGQVSMLGDAKFTVAGLFVEQTWHNVLRVDVRLSSDNIVLN